MTDPSLIIEEYENVLLGVTKKYSFRNIFNGPLYDRQREGGIIWRYAIETLLGWSERQAEIYLTPELIGALCLEKTLKPMGVEFGPRHYFNVRSVLQFAYPEYPAYDPAEEAIEEYRRVNHLDEWESSPDRHKYHAYFFNDATGAKRATAITDFVITKYYGDSSPAQIYNFFANNAEANKFVKEKGLHTIMKNTSKSPLDMIHYVSSISNNALYFNALITQAINNRKSKESM